MKTKGAEIETQDNLLMLSTRGSIFRALRFRNYRLFFIGQSISLVGTWTTRLATGWLVFRLTHSGLLLGVIGFTGQIPTFALAALGGVWADRLHRQRLLVLTQVLLMIQTLIMAVLTLTNRITFVEIVSLSLFQGFINAFEIPCRNSFLLDLVEGRANWGNAIAVTYSMENLARLLGAVLAGSTIAAFGEGYCFLIDAVSYFAVIVSLLLMHLKDKRPERSNIGVVEELAEGWKYVSGVRSIRLVLILFGIVCFVGVPYTVLMPLYAGTLLKGGPHTYGFLMAATGLGSLAAGMRLAIRTSTTGFEFTIARSAILFGIGVIGLSLSRNLSLSLTLAVVTGFGMMQQFAASSTLIQSFIPERKRGRVMSYWTTTYMGALPAGSLVLGTVAQALGLTATLTFSGMGCLIGGVWFWGQTRNFVQPGAEFEDSAAGINGTACE